MGLRSRLFALTYNRLMAGGEKAGLAEIRATLLAEAGGNVLEVGAGTGLNLTHYSGAVSTLTVTEPDASMLRRLERVSSRTTPSTTILRTPAEDLPFDNATFDTVVSTLVFYVLFRRELQAMAASPDVPDTYPIPHEAEAREYGMLSIPWWVTTIYVAFMVWTVANAHHPVLFLGGFLFFLGFDRATGAYSTLTDFKTPLLVGFFLGGLVIHGGLQGWWIAPVLARLTELPLFVGASVLTAFNDNALVTYLATLVPNLGDHLKLAVVQGAVTGGGLTVIANAPNPAGQALLGRFFGGTIHPLRLLAAAAIPTLIAGVIFHFL